VLHYGSDCPRFAAPTPACEDDPVLANTRCPILRRREFLSRLRVSEPSPIASLKQAPASPPKRQAIHSTHESARMNALTQAAITNAAAGNCPLEKTVFYRSPKQCSTSESSESDKLKPTKRRPKQNLRNSHESPASK